MSGSRASSTKTRIETLPSREHHADTCTDREQVPRKQGLKPKMRAKAEERGLQIESKFHENKD